MSETTQAIETRIQDILGEAPTSRADVESRLAREGFDISEAREVLERVDWGEMARKRVEAEENSPDFRPRYADGVLRSLGFSAEERRRALEARDWTKDADQLLKSLLEDFEPESEMRKDFFLDGYTEEQFAEAVARAGVDWREQTREAVKLGLRNHASRKELYGALEQAGYERSMIRAALRELNVDWYAEATKRAMSLPMLCSPEQVAEDLLEGGFTQAQADLAASTAQLDDASALSNAVDTYLREEGMSEEGLTEFLDAMGFSPESIATGAAICKERGVDWVEAAVRPIGRRMRHGEYVLRQELEEDLEEIGYSEAQISRALEVLKPQWSDVAFEYVADAFDTEMISPEFMEQILVSYGASRKEARRLVREALPGGSETESAIAQARRFASFFPNERTLRAQMGRGGFARDVVEETLRNLHFNWTEEAALTLKEMRALTPVPDEDASPALFLEALAGMEFEDADAEAAVRGLDLDWKEHALEKARSLVETGADEESVRNHLDALGYSGEDVDYAVRNMRA